MQLPWQHVSYRASDREREREKEGEREKYKERERARAVNNNMHILWLLRYTWYTCAINSCSINGCKQFRWFWTEPLRLICGVLNSVPHCRLFRPSWPLALSEHWSDRTYRYSRQSSGKILQSTPALIYLVLSGDRNPPQVPSDLSGGPSSPLTSGHDPEWRGGCLGRIEGERERYRDRRRDRDRRSEKGGVLGYVFNPGILLS